MSIRARPQPLDPVRTAPSRRRRSNLDTSVSRMQPPKMANLATSAQTCWSAVNNYINVILEPYKNACIVSVVDTKKALQAIADMGGVEAITQPDAAQVLNVSRATIARREKQDWPLPELLALADAYGVSRTRLMLQLGYLDDSDLYTVVGDGSLEGVPMSALTNELHKRATGG